MKKNGKINTKRYWEGMKKMFTFYKCYEALPFEFSQQYICFIR